jgi:predicted MFS family arabinose efflux permease
MQRTTSALAGGIAALLIAMGIGRFAYTPLLPAMQQAVGFDDRAAGALASANYAGYLLGALLLTLIPIGSGRLSRTGALRFSLVASIATTAAMAATQSLVAWGALRFLSGLASAAVFVLATAIVHAILSRRGQLHRIGIHFAGVGLGIALSGAVIAQARNLGWAAGWLLLAALSLVILVPAWIGLHDEAAPAPAQAVPPQPGEPIRLPVAALVVAYFCEGVGYIVTGTFLVAIARSMPTLAPWAEHLWTVVGLAAAPAAVLWAAAAQRMGRVPALIAAHLLQAIGIVLPAISGAPAAAMVAAILFGVTFVGITALAVSLAATIAPNNTARVIGLVTVAFGIGQIIGPLAGGWLAALTGSFNLALIGAGAVVAVGTLPLLLGLGQRRAALAQAD